MSRLQLLLTSLLLGGAVASAQLPLQKIEVPQENSRLNTESFRNPALQPQADTAISDSTLYIYVKDAGYDWISYQMKIDASVRDEQLAFQCFFVNRIDSLMYFNLHKSGIELARMVLTPDSVVFVNKMSKEYYRGGYEFVSTVLGFPLDFQMVQALLNNCDFPHFSPIRWQMEQDNVWSYISPLRTDSTETRSLMQQIDINPGTREIVRNDITDLGSRRSVSIRYGNFAPLPDTTGASFFGQLQVAVDGEGISMSAEVKSLKMGQPRSTSIKIPEGFSEIKLR